MSIPAPLAPFRVQRPRRERAPEAAAFVRRFYATEGYPPSTREVAKAIGIVSQGDTKEILDLAAEMGLLRRREGQGNPRCWLPPLLPTPCQECGRR